MKKQAAFLFIPLLFAFNMFGNFRHQEYRFAHFSFSSPSSDRQYQSWNSDWNDSAQSDTGRSTTDATDTSSDTSMTDSTTAANAQGNIQTPGVPNTGVDTATSITAVNPTPDTLPTIIPPTTLGSSNTSNSAMLPPPPPLPPSTLGNVGVSTVGSSQPSVTTPAPSGTTNNTFSSPPPASDNTLPPATGAASASSTTSSGEVTGQNVFSTGGVTFRFDDGWQSQFDVALPALQAAGFKGTFYIITHQLLDDGFSGFVSKAEVQQLASGGEEIGAHTQTHPHLPTLSNEQQTTEIAGSKADLESMGLSPHSFSYPYGEYTPATTQIAKDAGFSSAVTTVETPATPSSDRFQIQSPSYQITDTPATIEAQIQNALQNHQWLVMTFHRIDTSGDQYSITPSNFQEVVKYVADNHIPVVTVSEGASLLQ